MKKILTILIALILFPYFTVAQNNEVEYVDTGIKLGNDTIWGAFNLPEGSDKNICIGNSNQKQCLFNCKYCSSSILGYSEQKLLFPVLDNGILYHQDEFTVKYYNMDLDKDIAVSGEIYKYLAQFKNEEVYNILPDSLAQPFEEGNLNPSKNKYLFKMNQEHDWGFGGEPSVAALCILDLEKLSNDESDFFTCPVITDYVEIDRDKTENVWTGTSSVWFEGWKNDNELELKDTVQSFDYAENNKSIQVSYNLNLDSNELKVTNIDNPNDGPYFLDLSFSNPLFHKVIKANSQGWITGYPDGTVRLNDPVNRAEFAKMLMIAFIKGVGNGGNLYKFPDVIQGEWYVPYLSKAVEEGSMSGYPDGKMRPGNKINKAEALKMATELIQNRYPEVSADAQWYEKYRQYAINKNYDLDFLDEEDMGKDMTRGECIELILEALHDLGPG